MRRLHPVLLLLVLIAVLWSGDPSYGQTFLSCFSKETLDLIRTIATHRANFPALLVRKDEAVSAQDLGFANIATAERNADYVRCELTSIDKKTGNVLNHLNYEVGRTNSKPYVRVRFDTTSNQAYRCDPLFSQALVIPSETYCDQPARRE